MPVLHSYVDEDGFYINARPSSVGNVTYQVKKEAETLFNDLGYEDGDDLPWGLINPLRSASLIYTNSQGLNQQQDNAPSLDPSESPELTEDELQNLLDYLQSRDDIPERVYNKLAEKIETQKSPIKQVKERIHSKFPHEQTCVHITLASEEKEHNIKELRVEIESKNIEYYMQMLGDSTVDELVIKHQHEDNWNGIAKASELLPKLMRALRDVNAETPVEIAYHKVSSDNSNIVVL